MDLQKFHSYYSLSHVLDLLSFFACIFLLFPLSLPIFIALSRFLSKRFFLYPINFLLHSLVFIFNVSQSLLFHSFFTCCLYIHPASLSVFHCHPSLPCIYFFISIYISFLQLFSFIFLPFYLPSPSLPLFPSHIILCSSL